MKHSTPFSRLLFLVVLVSFSTSACSARIAINSMQPAPVNLGASREIAIVAGEGRRSAREFVFNDLIAQARAGGWFVVSDRSEKGAEAKLAGRTVMLSNATLGPKEWGMRIDVIEWQGSNETKTSEKVDEKGRSTKVETRVTLGKALLAVTLFAADGTAILAEREYEGTSESSEHNVTKDEMIERAGRNAVTRLLADITPRTVRRWVSLDEDEEQQKPIIVMAKKGNVARAAEDMRKYLDANPTSASAAYNLAVFTEAMGQYEEALAWYDKALSLGNKDLYVHSRAECAGRMAAASALSR